MLRDVLKELDNNDQLLYDTSHVMDPWLKNYYTTKVRIKVVVDGEDYWRTYSTHESDTPHNNYEASVNNTTKSSLSAICYDYRYELVNTRFRYLPQRRSGTKVSTIALGGNGGSTLHTLAHYTAVLNTEYESATMEMPLMHGDMEGPQGWICGRSLMVVIHLPQLKTSPRTPWSHHRARGYAISLPTSALGSSRIGS